MQKSNLEIKIEELAKYLEQKFKISIEEAKEIIYEEWDVVSEFIDKNEKNWFKKAAKELNSIYMVA